MHNVICTHEINNISHARGYKSDYATFSWFVFQNLLHGTQIYLKTTTVVILLNLRKLMGIQIYLKITTMVFLNLRTLMGIQIYFKITTMMFLLNLQKLTYECMQLLCTVNISIVYFNNFIAVRSQPLWLHFQCHNNNINPRHMHEGYGSHSISVWMCLLSH